MITIKVCFTEDLLLNLVEIERIRNGFEQKEMFECKRTWKEKRKRKNNAKVSGLYVCPRTHNVSAHALRSHQFLNTRVIHNFCPNQACQVLNKVDLNFPV